ncbi:MAG: flagellar export chaperone FliS [Planctomycetota bacterium]
MSYNPTSLYLEAEATTIPRLKLVRMMYAGAIESLQTAKARLQENDRPGFVRSINKSQNIVAELALSLDFEQGGDIAIRLNALYEWLQRTLTPACLEGKTEPIDDAVLVLTKLSEAWESIRDDDMGFSL